MRKDVIKDVTIKEPPLEELTRKYSTFSYIKRSCLAGCGCLVFLIIALILLLKFAFGVGPQELNRVPTDFPMDIQIYDEEKIEIISFVPGTYKNRMIEIAAIFPKIILSPIINTLDEENKQEPKDITAKFKDMWAVVNSPVSDKRHVIKIQWTELTAEPYFVYSYYKNELIKQDYIIASETTKQDSRQLLFSKGETDGSFYIKMDETKTKTILANLIVNYYPTTSTPK